MSDFPSERRIIPRRFIKLRLDLASFDETAFASIQSSGTGMRYESLGGMGDTPENRRLLYELNKQCSADIPGRGAFYDFSEYAAKRLDQPSFSPDAVTLAVDGARWVGMSALSDWTHKGFMFAEMTGVVRSHRRRGIGLAIKLLSIRHAKARGARWLLTICDSENPAPLALNRRLGFRDTDWPPILASKDLTAADGKEGPFCETRPSSLKD